MNIEEVRDFLLSLPNVEEVNPFSDDSEIIIYKIGGKWFAAYIFERPEFLAVKCNPDRAMILRDKFPAITPAWHFNKKHWNDLHFNSLRTDMVKQEIIHSYLTVIRKNVTPKSLKDSLLSDATRADIDEAEPFE